MEGFGTTWERAFVVVVSVAAMLSGVILYIRIVGLRSFAKISAFDFAVTLAVGSLLAGTAVSGAPLAEGLIAAGVLLALQAGIAYLRLRGFDRIVDNEPLLLVHEGRVIESNMRRARISMDDLRARLRASGLHSVHDAGAVILERAGDISVLDRSPIDPDLISDVRPGAASEERRTT